MSTPDPASFADLCGNLPDHHSEVMAGYRPRPTIAEQNATHGAPAAAADLGVTDQEKYGGHG